MGKKEKNNLTRPKGSALFTIADPKSPTSEQYKTLRTNIKFAQVDQPIKTLVVTSPGASEGKSTTASNLAITFAQVGMNTLLIDADMRRPTCHMTFGLDNGVGLSNLLTVRSMSLNDVTQASGVENLSVITSGPKSPNPSELLASVRMRKVIKLVSEFYDFVIFDMPPVVQVTDAQLIASQVDGVILSVREGVTNKVMAQKAVSLLDQVQANILGAVYTGVEDTQGYYAYSYS
ncbi:CpsD/CapB family tyrosine-protein kinase [Vagococcus vulneris]|uniref:Tyrosine-protein kinase CpsD n=1 Tax=Vagococcus vulneris TaxID=1977869 RepID=A0A429ZZX0_9ENTE|nr:CpsD/CapB family tyrosine-protein kinase [Vagococcus vulneris]RST99566.1 tyrosine protein kinase [Vagococcus vulneris]